MVDIRYPIGELTLSGALAPEARQAAIGDIAALPVLVAKSVAGIQSAGFDRRYRDDGWTVRQLVHHLADSHMNGYVRMKLALTEREPTIRPYDQAQWAQLPDVANVDPAVSISLLVALHDRWVSLLRSLDEEAFQSTYFHPEHGRALTIDDALTTYSWHGRHHVCHIDMALGFTP